MRKLFIAFGIMVFLVYCWASVVYQNRVDVPAYRLVEIDVLGGRTRAEWDADASLQFQRLMELEGKNYQLPVDAEAADASPDRPLTSADFARFVEEAPAGGPVRVQLRDASGFYRLLALNYRLRDSIADPADPDGLPLYVGGVPLDKDMLDDLQARGVPYLTVVGHGAPVSFRAGTAIMVAIIFLTLVAALYPVVWRPFLAMLEKRRRQLEIGAEAERQNQLEAIRFEEEKRRRHNQVTMEMREAGLKAQRETAKEAAAVVGAAREAEREVKLSGLLEIARATEYAREELDRQIPDLARNIADALTPGASRPGRTESGK